MQYLRTRIAVARALEDRAVATLWGAGTLGLEARDSPDGLAIFDAFFVDRLPDELTATLKDLGGRILATESLPDADWLATWREQAQPFTVGRRFLLDPREPGAQAPDARGRFLLRLPARTAFGTGSHESTRLVLELLEEMDLAGGRVLDVGTGTGVLAFAALLLGAREAVGLDVDLIAPILAGQNARINGLRPSFFAGGLAALRSSPDFDLALVNVIPEQISPEIDRLAGVLKLGAEAVFSGILAERGAETLAALGARGFELIAARTAGEWIAYRVRYAGSAAE